MEFAEWFVKMCAEKGVTTAEVASEIGVSAASTSYYANGRNMPKGTTLYKIEQYFGKKFEEHPDDILEALKEEDGAFLHSYATMTEEQKNMMRIFAKGLKNGT